MRRVLGASSSALRIVIAYGVVATLWIYLSDRALALMVSDQQMLVQWSVYKGIAFVAFTSVFLFVLTRRSLRAIERRSGQLRDTRAQLERLNHLYAALSQVGQAVVFSERPEELFQRVCETLVRQGAVSMAWIGMHDPLTQQLVPRAFFGAGSRFVQDAPIYADDRPEGRGPSGIAFRTGRPYVCNDLADDPGTLHWRAEAAGHGFRCCASFPVRAGVRVAGVLSVYAGRPGISARARWRCWRKSQWTFPLAWTISGAKTHAAEHSNCNSSPRPS
ncbi:MAG: GAF domain-containing protein [Ramlibacter sp.]|nr:GAF domain-containing protein [Ramlibacter sp.]